MTPTNPDPARARRASALLVRSAGALLCLPAAFAALLSCAPEKAAAEAPAAPRPHDGGTLRLLLEAPTSLDPADADSVYNSLPVNQLFDGLVAIDAGMRIVPALARR